MSDQPAGEGNSSAGDPPRVSLREAFGLAGGAALPDSVPAGPGAKEFAAGLYGGATRALLGRPPSEAEHSATMASLIPALRDQPIDNLVTALLKRLLASPEAVVGSIQHAPVDDTFSAVVCGVFRAALGREAGAEGLRVWRQLMGETFDEVPLEEFIFRFISATLSSGEFGMRHTAPVMASLRAQLLPPPASVGISTHISLGADGFTSGLLKRFALKRWSGPFDWCSTSPAIIRAALSDDFERFLDPDEWRAIPLEDRPDARFWQCHHPAYEAQHGHACILHNHDMTQEWGQVALLRSVERFRHSIRSLASKLVLQVVREGDDPGGDFLRTAEALEGMGRNVHFVMISLLPGAAEGPFPEIEPALARGAHRLLRARLMAPLEGVEARDMLDEVVLLRAALAAPTLGQDGPPS